MTPPAPPTMADAQDALARQAFSRHIGAELTRFGHEQTVLTIAVRPHHLQQHGLVHGGVVTYAADNAMAFAAGAVLGPAVVSSGLSIDFTTPARGESLVATAVLVTSTSRTAVVRCTVEAVDAAGVATTCAVGQGSFSLLRRRSEGA